MSKKSENKRLEKAEKKLKKEQKAKKNKSEKKQRQVSPQERAEMIATAAYYIAERHGFTPGRSEADWRSAEKEIDRALKGKKQAKGKKG